MAEVKKFTRKEVAERGTKSDVWFVIDNLVFNVTKFMDEHPGGHEVLVNMSGKDASEDFDDVGHSLDAKELMKKFQVGEVVDEEKKEVKQKYVKWNNDEEKETSFVSSWKFPVLLGVLMTVLYTYLFG